MENLVTALTSAIDSSALLGTITSFVPVIAGLIVFSFTYRIIRKVVTGASKGKARI